MAWSSARVVTLLHAVMEVTHKHTHTHSALIDRLLVQSSLHYIWP